MSYSPFYILVSEKQLRRFLTVWSEPSALMVLFLYAFPYCGEWPSLFILKCSTKRARAWRILKCIWCAESWKFFKGGFEYPSQILDFMKFWVLHWWVRKDGMKTIQPKRHKPSFYTHRKAHTQGIWFPMFKLATSSFPRNYFVQSAPPRHLHPRKAGAEWPVRLGNTAANFWVRL